MEGYSGARQESPAEHVRDEVSRVGVDRDPDSDSGGSLPEVWTRFGKPDGLFIDANDVLYLTDANSRPGADTGWEQGIRIGDTGTGWIEAFIPSPSPADAAGGWDGVTADMHGDICAAGPRPSMDVRRSQHVRRLVNVRARLQERGGR